MRGRWVTDCPTSMIQGERFVAVFSSRVRTFLVGAAGALFALVAAAVIIRQYGDYTSSKSSRIGSLDLSTPSAGSCFVASCGKQIFIRIRRWCFATCRATGERHHGVARWDHHRSWLAVWSGFRTRSFIFIRQRIVAVHRRLFKGRSSQVPRLNETVSPLPLKLLVLCHTP